MEVRLRSNTRQHIFFSLCDDKICSRIKGGGVM